MFNRILVPLDGSLLAEQALPHAEQFARIFGASIVLLQVLDVNSDQGGQVSTDPLSWKIRKAEANLYMQEISAQVRENLGIPRKETGGEKVDEKGNEDRVAYVIREGKSAENIIDFAHTENVDLLVISSHGSGGLSRWNMSSIIQKVIDLVYLPLLVVRSNNQQEETNRRLHYRNILLPFDSSRRAESALSAAIVLMQGEALLVHAAEEASFGADRPLSVSPEADAVLPESKLFLAAVVTPPEIPLPRPYPEEISKLTDQLLQVSRDAVQAYLRVMKLRLPVESEINVVESSNVSSAIEELANQVNADLVLMSAHGYSGQFTYPYGSVTRRYMEQGSKPVLVIQDLPRSQVQSTSRGASRIVEPRASGVRQASTYS